MKKIKMKLLPVIAVLAAFVITSCGKDDAISAVLPSVTVTATADGEALASGDEVTVGSAVVLNISVSAPGGVNGLDVNGTSYSRSDLGAESGDTSGSIILNITAPTVDQIGNTATFEIEAVDDLGQTSAVVTFTYSIIAAPSPDARSYSAVLLAAPTGDMMNANFFSVSAGEEYSSDDVTSTSASISPTIDFGYYYGASDEASIASPEGFKSTVFSSQVSGWTTTNATLLRTTSLNATQFNETTTYADIDAAYEAGTADANGIISGLAAGDVLAFETVNGVRGLIHIESIDLGTDGTGFDSDASVTINVLAQLEATATN